MFGIVMAAALAGASNVPAQGRHWDEINGVYGTYGGYGNFSGCGYASYGCYSGCGPGCGYVYFVDNGCCNFPVPVFVPAPPCRYGFCPAPMDFMIGPPIMEPGMDADKDEMINEKPAKKMPRKRKKRQEDNDEDDDEARLRSGRERDWLRAEMNLRFNYRAALAEAMWRRARM